ncbi:MAG: type II toxin-antitoxin system PemK/MazF family toxin [Gallionella sp.]|jgi:uncharacterized protein YifN (PemK superfamily)
MTVLFHPNPGTILLCDYDGFEVPEMVKPRPVLIVSPRSRHNDLFTIVPVSTTPPTTVLPWHHKIILPTALSPKWPELEIWIKGDMLNTFARSKFDRFHARLPNGGRKYYDRRISDADLAAVRTGITAFLTS